MPSPQTWDESENLLYFPPIREGKTPPSTMSGPAPDRYCRRRHSPTVKMELEPRPSSSKEEPQPSQSQRQPPITGLGSRNIVNTVDAKVRYYIYRCLSASVRHKPLIS